MTARVRTTDSGAVVEASLSEWRAVGRFLHVDPRQTARVLTLTGLSADEAEHLAARVNAVAILANPVLRDDDANPVRRVAIGRRPFTLLECRQ